ncbi:MAG: hypothetical protein DHS20C02_01560 [Micavibrio sp.]|nr:MAG: hypothetical protein DHS20C02_01560 [Micavibrio sp.]
MDTMIRHAEKPDAQAIHDVAQRVSAKKYILDYLDGQGREISHLTDMSVNDIKARLPELITEDQINFLNRRLAASGFILYPLAVDDPDQPNYAERIKLSNHFWLANNDDVVKSFMMAYTLEKMEKIRQKTGNDTSVLDYFLTKANRIRDGIDMPNFEKGIYVQQVATMPSVSRTVTTSMVQKAALPENVGDAPFMLGEIAQEPDKNRASTLLFLSLGGKMVATRPKDNGQRTSGTFMKLFPSPEDSL